MSSIDIFIIETELQYLASIEIQKLEGIINPIIFTFSESLSAKLVTREIQHIYLDRNWSGTLQKIIKIRRYLKQVNDVLESRPSFQHIHMHTPRIDQIHQNLFIHSLQKKFPNAQLHLRMIPDGILNTVESSSENSNRASLLNRLKHLKYLPFQNLRYYYFSGCKIGIDDPLFDKLYTFKGIRTNYPYNKIKTIKLNLDYHPEKSKQKHALVIGQRALDLKLLTTHEVNVIANRIKLEVERLSINSVDYLGHPRSPHNEFNINFNVIKQDVFCAEELYGKTHYSCIIGCSSTALINAKMLLPDSVVISVGLDMIYANKSEKYLHVRELFESAGIVVL